MRRLAYAAVFVTVLWAGLTFGAIATLCDDTNPDW